MDQYVYIYRESIPVDSLWYGSYQ